MAALFDEGGEEVVVPEACAGLDLTAASQPPPVSADYLRRGRGAAATRLRGLSASQPRRRRDPFPRTIRVAAAAPPRPVCGRSARRTYVCAQTRTRRVHVRFAKGRKPSGWPLGASGAGLIERSAKPALADANVLCT